MKHLDVTEYSAFLKSMGIDTVPTLMVNAPTQKLFITGKDAILRYLVSCEPPQETKPKDRKKTKKDASSAVPAPGSGTAGDIFILQPLVTAPGVSAEKEGVCKQDEVCK